jgi:hypothetical protein
MSTRIVKLTYFKDTGSYYSEGELEVAKDTPFWADIYKEVRERVASGDLPGLVQGARFHTLIEDPDGYGVPQLILKGE